jgi:DNA-binding SARP family transcriptional activator
MASRPDCHLLPGLFTAGATTSGYLLLDLEALRITGCDGPADLVDQVIRTAATELATGQWTGWYELILVGCAELDVLGRAEHCDGLDDALALLADRSAAVARRLDGQRPADLRQLRLAAPQDEDWGLTILISTVEPTEEQLARLMDLAVDGPGGIGALVAGDQETPDGRMASTVLQLAPDPQQGGIVASVVPLQLTIRPRALSAAEYEAITTMFAVAADTADADPDESPYVLYSAPPWVPQAAVLRPDGWRDETRPPDVMADDDVMAWPDSDGDEVVATDGVSAAGVSAAGVTAGGVTGAGVAPGGVASDGELTPGDLLPGQAGLAGWPADTDDAGLRPMRASGPPPDEPRQSMLRVKILGPFTITGAADQLQPKHAELVLALALAAPAGLTNSALCSMLGADPDHPKPGDAVRQIITRTRRRLGRSTDGQEYIIHTGNGRYVLHPDAELDWTEFRSLTASAQLDDLRAAVALVRGQPFGGSFYWWVDIPLLETVRAEVVDAAETLAEFELANGSPRAAARAARTGLLAESSAEQLWRALMRAEHAAANLAGVTEAWRRCLDAIEDIAPGGEPHPDTAALYRQLTMPSRQRTAAR